MPLRHREMFSLLETRLSQNASRSQRPSGNLQRKRTGLIQGTHLLQGCLPQVLEIITAPEENHQAQQTAISVFIRDRAHLPYIPKINTHRCLQAQTKQDTRVAKGKGSGTPQRKEEARKPVTQENPNPEFQLYFGAQRGDRHISYGGTHLVGLNKCSKYVTRIFILSPSPGDLKSK